MPQCYMICFGGPARPLAGSTPLDEAKSKGHTEVVKILEDAGATGHTKDTKDIKGTKGGLFRFPWK